MKKSILAAIALIVNGLRLLAQPADTLPERFVASARWASGSVELRWAPTDYATWQLGNRRGYLVERIGEQGPPVLVTPAPLRPIPLADWVAKTDTSNRWNKAAAQLLYGKAPVPPPTGGLGTMKEVGEWQAFAHAQALIAADLSQEAARGMALSFFDEKAAAGQSLMYRVSIADSLGGLPGFSKEKVGQSVAYAFVNTKEPWAAPEVRGLVATGGEHSARLEWPKAGNSRYFTAYDAEKSLDGGRTWARLNELPIFTTGFAAAGQINMFIDSLSENYRPALYRVRGLTAWGDAGQPSKPVKCMGRDLTPPGGAENITARSLAANKIEVKWEARVNEADLAGWFVERGNDPKGLFEKVNQRPLPASARQFFDTEPFAFELNFYRVVAIDTAGNEGHSFSAYCHIVDSIPPAAPVGLVGKIDTSGIVAIAWDHNQEPDLRGYRVYFSHGREGREFNQVTAAPIGDNFFGDTIPLKVLNEEIFYRVVAVDWRWNHSAYSEWLPLKKPDVVPPVAPVFKEWSAEKGGARLRWANSPSRDVAKQVLWKKEGDDGAWQPLREWAERPFPTAFLYKNEGETAVETQFALESIDDDGLPSGRSEPLSITILPTENRPGVDGLTAVFDEKTGTARLAWQYDGKAPADDRRFLVMRGAAAGELSGWRSVGGGELAFSEKLGEKGRYRYAVKTLYVDGSESVASGVVEVVSR